ncbi:MAG: helix-turn-helix transcriptional regulator [Syntrophomonas sp.]|uniref:helix-turn-helix transcriptional regulator n=1 Tax=Syntrophomonas sp. TaxID=2053627 RepID=UPI00260ED420|nr:helix-turn-helix transcriptional regulator [Syntrophomonas sp.]MDD2509934.1 helix-turn-helix transcriptional regulator [Syntrophomonas sp.]MDD3879729.1 helix-turn-helix transcriptional regulator [Syntrophomonas sp.]MDD4626062.1 helix-turn-helix transcriptional regulator [Syntrophomonas sp.]
MIPDDAEKPVDPRKEKKPPGQSLSSELAYIIEATSIPMPTHNPDAILKIVKEEKLRLQYEGELAYLRGDFARAMRCYDKTEGDEAARLRASLVAVVAAISLGDYPAYLKIEAYLKSFVGAGRGRDSCAIAELALASVAVSVIVPNMVPKWLSEGDFSAFPVQVKPPYILYLRARYFMCIGKYEIALAVAQTALTFYASEQGITLPEIYLRVVCALSCHCLGRENEARRWLLEAMRIALPHGFITPFAEPISEFGGIVEQCLEEAFPDYCDAVIGQWKRTVKNWITFHNYFTKDNITVILSLREYHLAQLVARRVPYVKVAKQFNISVGRLKNIMLEIYEKLFISNRDELAQYVLMTNKGAGS